MHPLVTPSWLASRLTDPGIVVLDATLPPVGVMPRLDTRARYAERHIPGAVFFDIEEFSDTSTTLPHMLPSAEAFTSGMSALGVGDGDTIVIYEQEGVFSAPRAWWMLRTFGAKDIYLLDGGLKAWIAEGLPTESGAAVRAPASFRARLDQDSVADFAQIQQAIAEGGQILDARSAGRFAGTSPEPRAGLSSGHMPGATSIPFTELVEDGRLKPAEKLRLLFADKGVDLDQTITTSCGSGVTAAVIALGLEIAGGQKIRLYDGSWTEYAQQPTAMIEMGSQPISSPGSSIPSPPVNSLGT